MYVSEFTFVHLAVMLIASLHYDCLMFLALVGMRLKFWGFLALLCFLPGRRTCIDRA